MSAIIYVSSIVFTALNRLVSDILRSRGRALMEPWNVGLLSAELKCFPYTFGTAWKLWVMGRVVVVLSSDNLISLVLTSIVLDQYLEWIGAYPKAFRIHGDRGPGTSAEDLLKVESWEF